jgi:hypothetical protein
VFPVRKVGNTDKYILLSLSLRKYEVRERVIKEEHLKRIEIQRPNERIRDKNYNEDDTNAFVSLSFDL